MAPQASSAARTSQEPRPEQHLASPHLALAGPQAAAQRNLRPLEVAECAMCGIALPLAFLVPDGGQACADIRWYCKDARSCTERWTASRGPRDEHTPAYPGNAVAGAGPAFPEAASA